jgi:peptide-methionine (R)-S-oxide reductase
MTPDQKVPDQPAPDRQNSSHENPASDDSELSQQGADPFDSGTETPSASLGSATEWRDRSDEFWLKRLTPDQFRVLRRAGTERAFTGEYWNHFDEGHYVCAACGEMLFRSSEKFDSHCGWPSFSAPADRGLSRFLSRARDVAGIESGNRSKAELVTRLIEEKADLSHGMNRVEVLCQRCGSHLGHVFDDGPPPTRLRYCINSLSLRFVPDQGEKSSREDGDDK